MCYGTSVLLTIRLSNCEPSQPSVDIECQHIPDCVENVRASEISMNLQDAISEANNSRIHALHKHGIRNRFL